MITNFFDTQKNKKKEYKLNTINNLKKENQLQKQKHVQLGETLEQEINHKDETKRQQFTKYLIDKIKTLEVELKETKEQINEYQEKISAMKKYDELIHTLKNKLQEIEIEKNGYKQQWELTKTQLMKTIEEKNGYKQYWEQTKSQWEQTKSQLDQTKSQWEQTKSQLEQTKSQLDQTKSQLEQTKSQLDQTKSQLDQTIEEKNNYKQQLELTKSQLNKTIEEKNSYKQYCEQTKSQLEQTKQQIIITENKNDNITSITNIPTIYFIYQYKYKHNTQVTGLGDFIRGCFYIMQFSEKYNIYFDFNIYNHSLKKYLNYFYLKEDIINTVSKDILFFQKENCHYFTKNNVINYIYSDVDKELLNIIKQTPSYNKNKYLYLINHPNERFITEQHKKKIRELFEPTLELQTMIDNSLSSINLIKYKYIIIHIRMNDSSFNGDYINFKNEQINYIINIFNSIKKNRDEELFLISSNNVVKNYILQKLPKIKTIFKEISHIGESKLDNDDSLINTLLDFYTMSYSKHIYSFSVYEHGSGFSKWCAKMYNIPYICFKL
jgi:hypothetical protein